MTTTTTTTTTTEAVLAVEGLEVQYGEARALFGVDLEVAAGQVVAVLGPNGAGKTSLAAAITGRVTPAAGTVHIAGQDVTGRPTSQISRLGVAYVPEERAIFPHLSVIDNLRVLLRYAAPKAERAAALDRALELFPVLAERRRQQAGTLSGGEQQMLALARVLAAPPKLLVADEMSLGLAPLLVDLVFDSLARARAEGVTVLLIEQYVERALDFADDAVLLRRGRVAWRGPASSARDKLVAEYLGGETSS
jgi:branched-chain amino acid transport system ATP-binding protein